VVSLRGVRDNAHARFEKSVRASATFFHEATQPDSTFRRRTRKQTNANRKKLGPGSSGADYRRRAPVKRGTTQPGQDQGLEKPGLPPEEKQYPLGSDTAFGRTGRSARPTRTSNWADLIPRAGSWFVGSPEV